MNKRVVVVGLVVLIAGLAVYMTSAGQRIEVPYDVEIPYQDLENREQLLKRVEDFSIRKGEHASWSHYLIQGRALNITWQAENKTVDVYVMNESQYNNFTQTRGTQCLVSASALSSFLMYPSIPFNATFHIVIYNDPKRNVDSVKILYYESRLMWEEEVTKYRSETRYKEEPNYFGINVGSAIFVIGCIIEAFGWRSRSRNPNPSRAP